MKEHTRVKHKILESYLTRWAAILGRRSQGGKARTLHYVDTHAGRAIYNDGEQGSPIIAMKIGEELHEHLNGSMVLDCHNIEQNTDYFTQLEEEVRKAKVQCPSVQVKNYHGDFRQHIGEVFASIPAGEACFIFLDPFGYKDVELSTLFRFLEQRRYHEIFITFMSQFISRFMSDETKHSTLDTVLDTKTWREYIGRTESEAKVVDLYAHRIQEVGKRRLGREVFAYPIKIVSGQSPYYLIHVSQAPKARIVMEEAVLKNNALFQNSSPFLSIGCSEEEVLKIARSNPNIKALDLAGKIWLQHLHTTWKNGIRVAIKSLNTQEVLTIKDKNGKERNKGVFPNEADLILANEKDASFSQSLF